MPRYLLSGLNVESEIVLPGASVVEGARPADVVIHRGVVPESLPAPAVAARQLMIQDSDILLRVPDVVRILIQNGRAIRVEAEPGTEDADVVVYVIGTALGILLQQRGELVLHGSAVEHGGRAMLFSGQSGAGKSTLAAALTRRGFPLVADDVAALFLDGDGRPSIYQDHRDLKLWADATDGLDLTAGRAVHRRLNKYYVAPPVARASSPLPLGAIYFLAAAESMLRIEPLSPVAGATALRRNAYRPRLVAMLGQELQYFAQSMRLLSTVPVFTLAIPHDWNNLPAALEALETHFRTTLRD